VFAPKYGSRKAVVCVDAFLDSHSEFSKHDRDQSAGACAGDEVEYVVRLDIMVLDFSTLLISNFFIDLLH
jgi:hypothetical protein